MLNLANLTTPELMEIHINTLFCCDADGYLRCVNEASEPPAPLFYMGRTPQANLWRVRYDLPATTRAELDALCRAEPLATDFTRPPQYSAQIKAVLAEHVALDQQQEYRGPAFYVAEDHIPLANTVLITDANAELLRENFDWALPFAENQSILPIAVTVEGATPKEARAVSVCFCSRRPGQATEAGLETVVEFRGKGYGSSTVAAWATAVHAMGCMPLYSTSWDNLASRAIARKMGMRFYGEDWSIR